MMPSRIHIECNGLFELPWRTVHLEEWLSEVALGENTDLFKLGVFLVNDEELLRKNQEFLDHDTFTDIITFDYSSRGRLKGELWISEERAAENAKKIGMSVDNEILRLLAHGVLHLAGQGDKSKEESVEMSEKENRALENWTARSVPRGTQS